MLKNQSDFKNQLVQAFKLKIFLSLIDINNLDKIFKLPKMQVASSCNTSTFLLTKKPVFLNFFCDQFFDQRQAFLFLSRLRYMILTTSFKLSRFTTARHAVFDRRYSGFSPVETIALKFHKFHKDVLNMRAIMRFKFFINFYLSNLVAANSVLSRFKRLYKTSLGTNFFDRIYKPLVRNSWMTQSSFIIFNAFSSIFSPLLVFKLLSQWALLFYSTAGMSYNRNQDLALNSILVSIFSSVNTGSDFFDFFLESGIFKTHKLKKSELNTSLLFINNCFSIFEYSSVFSRGAHTGLFLYLNDLRIVGSPETEIFKYVPLQKNYKNFFKLYNLKITARDRLNIQDFGYYYPFSSRDYITANDKRLVAGIMDYRRKKLQKQKRFIERSRRSINPSTVSRKSYRFSTNTQVNNVVSFTFIAKKILARKKLKAIKVNYQQSNRSFENSFSSGVFFNEPNFGGALLSSLHLLYASKTNYNFVNYLLKLNYYLPKN